MNEHEPHPAARGIRLASGKFKGVHAGCFAPDGGRWTVRRGVFYRPAMAANLLRKSVLGDADERHLIAEFLGPAPGTFVEVGANDPVVLSQTYHLEQRGWRGILVEPLRECAERLRAARRARVFAVAAGAPENDGRELPLLVAGALSTLQASIVEDVAAAEVRSVPVRTLDSMLAEAGFDRVDFLSVDVEGAELAVLRGFSIARYRPRLILIEDDVQDLSKHAYLEACGYKLVRRTALNNWYVPKQTDFPVSMFGRWQIIRKLYLATWWRRFKRRRKLRRRDARRGTPRQSPAPAAECSDPRPR
jgi:FkbM family methyltransferase